MHTPDMNVIERSWPTGGTEGVDACPYCGSTRRSIAFKDVQDWSFYCAPGKWTYWDCQDCNSLYLSPRPTSETIGLAYGRYYTHAAAGKQSVLGRAFKRRIVNEYYSHYFRTRLSPRLHVPRSLSWLLRPLRNYFPEPFGLKELATLPKGRLIDVGCGSGATIKVASRFGWDATGLELDPQAVKASLSRGMNVIEGTYERLAEFEGQFDCVICSHVLEHVADPNDLLLKIKRALRPGGTLLLSLPNATSGLRYHFRENWRGLEAPRHLAIPSLQRLREMLVDMGFDVEQKRINLYATATESSRITRRAQTVIQLDIEAEDALRQENVVSNELRDDLIHFVCVRMD